MITQNENRQAQKQPRMSPDVAEFLHMLRKLESRTFEQPPLASKS